MNNNYTTDIPSYQPPYSSDEQINEVQHYQHYHEGDSSYSWGAIILVIVIIIVIIIIIWWFFFRNDPAPIIPPNNGSGGMTSYQWMVVTGTSATTESFVAGNNMYYVSNGATTVNITQPSGNLSGQQFAISNATRSTSLVVSGVSINGQTITGSTQLNTIQANKIGWFVWTSSGSVTRLL